MSNSMKKNKEQNEYKNFINKKIYDYLRFEVDYCAQLYDLKVKNFHLIFFNLLLLFQKK